MKMKGFENGFKSGAFWKCIVSKTLFLVWICESGGSFESGTEKKASYVVVSISVLGCVNVDNRQKGMKKYALLKENKLASTGKNDTKTLAWP